MWVPTLLPSFRLTLKSRWEAGSHRNSSRQKHPIAPNARAGVPRPSIGVLHATLRLLGMSHVIGGSAVSATPRASGPRNDGQFAIKAKDTTKAVVIYTISHRTNEVIRGSSAAQLDLIKT